MDAPKDYTQFKLIKKLEQDVYLAERTADGEEFLARRLGEFDNLLARLAKGDKLDRKRRETKGLMRLLYGQNYQRLVMHVLNHENLVSVAGWTRQRPFSDDPAEQSKDEDFLVWDHCDAGTLQQQFHGRTFDYHPDTGFMPESFCWHVLTSVLRALAWLHEGYRREQVFGSETLDGHDDMADGEPPQPEFVGRKLDADWNPILHRDIGAHAVFFQHPRGGETYGLCKLGNFSRAFVSGHFVGDEDRGLGAAAGHALAPRIKRDTTLDLLRKGLANPMSVAENVRAYTIADEHYALAALVFKMMRGDLDPIPSATAAARRAPDLARPGICAIEGCDCVHVRVCPLPDEPCMIRRARREQGCRCTYGGCEHVLRTGPCVHGVEQVAPLDYRSRREAREEGPLETIMAPGPVCAHSCARRGQRPYSVDDALVRLPYSAALRAAVRKLFEGAAQPEGVRVLASTTEVMLFVEEQYRWWRARTEEGNEHRDVDDDVRARWVKRERERRAELVRARAVTGEPIVVH